MKVDQEIYRWLISQRTLAVGQAADLKVTTALVRIWLVRTGTADGEPSNREVEVEILDNGTWYEATDLPNRRLVRQFADEALRVSGYVGGGRF